MFVSECLSDPTEKNSVLKDTSDSNLLENYLKPHISPSDYTHSELQNVGFSPILFTLFFIYNLNKLL